MKKGLAIRQFFWRLILPYRWYFLFMLLAPVVGALYFPLSNYVIKLLVDIFSSDEVVTWEKMWVPAFLFVIIQLGIELLWRMSDYAEMVTEPRFRAQLTEQAYAYVAQHSYGFFQDNAVGKVASKVTSLQKHWSSYFDAIHYQIVGSAFRVLFTVISVILVSPIIGLLTIGWIGAFFGIMFPLYKKLEWYSYIHAQKQHGAFGFVTDSLSNNFIVKLCGLFSQEKQQVRRELDKAAAADYNKLCYQLKIQTLGSIFYIVFYTSFFFILLYLRRLRAIGLGDFAFVFTTALYGLDYVWKLLYDYRTASRDWGELQSAFTLLAQPYDITDRPGAKELVVTKGKIDFESISFMYPDGTKVFHDFSLHIAAGEKVGLVGISGAGKSTLVKLLLRLFDVTGGAILVDDQDIATITQQSLRGSIAFIPQDISLFHRTLFENIHCSRPDAVKDDIVVAAKQAKAHEFISALPHGYETIVGERGLKLSGGQRQRIAIARAFLQNAKILVLDEATSALDSETEKEIQESVAALISRQNNTVIAIAHRLSTLRQMDRIIVLDGGKIIEQGTHEELLQAEGPYKRLWDIQQRIG